MLSVVPSFWKSHDQLVGAPVDVSVKLTVSGASPLVGVAVKAAVGAVPGGGGGGGGVVPPPTRTHLATDGTPWLSVAISMYQPGGAWLALGGAVTFSVVPDFVKVSGT